MKFKTINKLPKKDVLVLVYLNSFDENATAPMIASPMILKINGCAARPRTKPITSKVFLIIFEPRW